jgi:uncharacterized lipoprotein NlpE involved in copper resistance
MIKLIIFIIILVLFVIFLGCNNRKEGFVNNLSIINPYSLWLHRNISEKERWWNRRGSEKRYYYSDMIDSRYLDY